MPRRKTTMSDEHKAALAQGRAEGKAVREYLDALEQHKPRRGRKRTPDSVRKQLAALEAELAEATGIRRVELIQRRLDLQGELERLGEADELPKLERAFVKAAKSYSARRGISYAAWREAGVPADVLRRAGIGRGG